MGYANLLQTLVALGTLVAAGALLFAWGWDGDGALPLWMRLKVRWRVNQQQITQAIPYMLRTAFVAALVSYVYYGLRQLWTVLQFLRARGSAAMAPSI